MSELIAEFKKGVFKENPVFRLVLGLCPTLAVTTSASNGAWMAIATTFVLVCSNIMIALLKKLIPAKIRIPCFIVIIASFVTIVELVMHAFVPDVYKTLGIFIPLIVVNCVIMGRAEAFASKNGVLVSALDGLGMGLGFFLSLTLLGFTRELLGSGKIFGYNFMTGFQPMGLMVLAPGGFLCLGLYLGFFNWLNARKKAAK